MPEAGGETFHTEIKVRFGDEDHARIVYFPRILHYFHCAFEDFFDAHGSSYREVLDQEQLGWPAAHLEVDFISPMRFGQRIDVSLQVAAIGETSARFRYVAREGERVTARAEITVVCVNIETVAPQPIPEKYRALFARYASA